MGRPRRATRRQGTWSLYAGRWFGVPVRIHWTFFLLIAAVAGWVGWSYGWTAGGWWALTIGCLFVSVLLHELGHSLTSIAFGHAVREIILLPIGGISRMEEIAEDPLEELLITAAGPLVNFAIALLLAAPISAGWAEFHMVDPTSPHLISNLLWLNLVLGFFNLLPAFPMDGGRILRALLTLMMGRLLATRVASAIGQGIALLMIVAGLFLPQIWFILIGGFVLLAARAEGRSVAVQERLRGVRAGEVAILRPRLLREDASLGEAEELARSSFQVDFPVVDSSGRLIGVLDRSVLEGSLEEADRARPVRDFATEPLIVRPEEELVIAYRKLGQSGRGAAVLVDGDGRPIGLLPVEQVRKALAFGWGKGEETGGTGGSPPGSPHRDVQAGGGDPWRED